MTSAPFVTQMLYHGREKKDVDYAVNDLDLDQILKTLTLFADNFAIP
jgi:hypothetical protein